MIAAFTILLLISFVSLDLYAPAGRNLVKIRGVDPVNYFGIAHSLLFDHDFNLNNEFTRVQPDSRIWSEIQKTGLPGSVWGVGYSILEMPLLAAGTALDAAVGNPADGYSRCAIYAYCLGNVLMTGLGMAALFTFLYQVGGTRDIPDNRRAGYSLFVTFAIFFGTNVGYYAFPQSVHASTFLFVSLFLAYWWKIRLTNDSWRWLALGLIGGFLSICRWQDLLYLGGPGIFDLLQGEPWKRPIPWLRSRLVYVAGVLVCWIPQMLEWKAIYGKYLTLPQGDGFLSFPPRFIWQVLFSSRNGWFLWTPLTILGVLGLFYGALKMRNVFVPWIVVLALEVTVIGSMKTWHGFDSFSARYLLSNSSIVGLGLFTLLCASTTAMRRALMAVTAACCIYTCLFAVQYRFDLIPNNENLTFTELVIDKFRLPQVHQRKAAAAQAKSFLEKGDAASAVRVLEVASALGEDRDVLRLMGEAYRAAGEADQAAKAESRRQGFLNSRLN